MCKNIVDKLNKAPEESHEIFEKITNEICLLHLVVSGELREDATLRDSEWYFASINKHCDECEYVANCLAIRYSNKITEGVYG